MSSTWRFLVFFATALTVWTLMHAYVFWRLAHIPSVAALLPRRGWLLLAVVLWWLYVLGRVFHRLGVDGLGYPMELVGALWMGVLFLFFMTFLVADLVTGFGLLLPAWAPHLRAAAVFAALLLSVIGVVQGMRSPVVREYEVALPGLSAERDGTVLVQLSDLHLGTLLGERWLDARLRQVVELRPDIVVITGDLIDGDARGVERLLPRLRTLRAPLGVWAVTGNHEYYAGIERSVALLEQAGYRVLRDRWAEVAPGLVLAGVDDLTARRQFGDSNQSAIEQALTGRPTGATILLSHTPWQAGQAAASGAGLMLSGHTHDAQIWPFGYLVKLTYPLLGGRYQVDGLPVIVSRGTGTWGPRMRLWRPAEIVRITLRKTRGQGTEHRG